MRLRVALDPHTDANEALREANANLVKAKSQDKEVTEVVTSLRTLREHNHFAEQLRSIMKGF